MRKIKSDKIGRKGGNKGMRERGKVAHIGRDNETKV